MGTLKTFKQFTEETTKSAVITFGRFNPPTIGHGKLLDAVANIGTTKGASVKIYASQSVDPKKNPLTYEEKIKFMRKMFPKHARNIISSPSVKNIFDVMVFTMSQGFTKVYLVVGSDRIDDFKSLLTKYDGVQGKHGMYQFSDGIEVISAGERDPDSEDVVSGMSASKMRDAAAKSDFQSFLKGLPAGYGEARDLFNAVRKGMGLSEMTNFRSHIEMKPVSEVRDLYVKGQIFTEGSKFCTKDNSVFTVAQRKTNFVIGLSESGIEQKFWLNQIAPILEETYSGNEFFEKYGELSYDEAALSEAEYRGRKVELDKPLKGDVKKFKVYVKNKEGNVVKINFGDPDMTIKSHIPARRKSFRARHKCDTDPPDKETPRYWSCKKW